MMERLKIKIGHQANSQRAILMALGLAFANLAPCAFADQNFDSGVQYFKKKDYKSALGYFSRSVSGNPADENTLYYRALTYQNLGQKKEAVADYARVIFQFPGTAAANYSKQALTMLDPGYCRQLMSAQSDGQRQSAAGASTNGATPKTAIARRASRRSAAEAKELARLPNETRIYFQQNDQSRNLIISASVNGRPTQMFFDTGASMTVFGKNQLKALGIQPPEGDPVSYTAGVGTSSPVPIWQMRVTLKVGDIIRNNFQIAVQDNLDVLPLLGQTFFDAFAYEIDRGAGTIRFYKKSEAHTTISANDPYAVQFERFGNNILVPIEVKGRQIRAYFDTGAESALLVTRSQLAQMGITIPEDATRIMTGGIGGTTTGVQFPVGRVKMGPIEQADVMVNVVDNAGMDYPLIGQGFLGSWQYKIDYASHCIHFVRR